MKYWQTVLQIQPLHCIYTDDLLTIEDDLSLDHYLPWSFVAHDQLWNLIPVSRSVNSAKSNNIPSEQYFSKFVTMQHEGIIISKRALTERRWKNFLESHMNDLKLTPDTLLDKDQLHHAYELTVNSQIALAANQGFSTNWVYLRRSV
jgi:CRISPR/Cas system Type II protein with McrA/HNH and RuvC-like nuclease domain